MNVIEELLVIIGAALVFWALVIIFFILTP